MSHTRARKTHSRVHMAGMCTAQKRRKVEEMDLHQRMKEAQARMEQAEQKVRIPTTNGQAATIEAKHLIAGGRGCCG